MISMSPFLDMLRITLLSLVSVDALVVSKTFIVEKAVAITTIFDVRGEDPSQRHQHIQLCRVTCEKDGQCSGLSREKLQAKELISPSSVTQQICSRYKSEHLSKWWTDLWFVPSPRHLPAKYGIEAKCKFPNNVYIMTQSAKHPQEKCSV